MSAREKPAPLVWKQDGHVTVALLGVLSAKVWHVGGQFSHRSRVDGGRIVSHFGEDSAKVSAEKRLRKAAS